MPESSGTQRIRERSATDRQLIHRLALQIINLLPDGTTEAQAVLARASFLLGTWADEPDSAERDALKIVKVSPD